MTANNDDDALVADPVPIDSRLIIQKARDETAWAEMEEGFVNNIFCLWKL